MIGRTLGQYRIVAKLGAGGMGVVYRAHDSKLRRDVALKFLPDDIASNEIERDRLQHEALAASALNHPNIAVVYDLGEIDGQVFIAMELVEGRSLREHIPSYGLPGATLLRYGRQIAAALAHDRGVVHRDLKSANVVVSVDRSSGAWELCDTSGNCVTINQDVPDVSRLGLRARLRRLAQ